MEEANEFIAGLEPKTIRKIFKNNEDNEIMFNQENNSSQIRIFLIFYFSILACLKNLPTQPPIFYLIYNPKEIKNLLLPFQKILTSFLPGTPWYRLFPLYEACLMASIDPFLKQKWLPRTLET